jgi:hypothetical protein
MALYCEPQRAPSRVVGAFWGSDAAALLGMDTGAHTYISEADS